jgi:hypothetical protein
MNNFRSQICTTIEQSQRLLDFGLKPETADMSYYILDDEPVLIIGMTKVYRETRKGGKIIKKQNAETIPAWSLHRLIEIAEVSVELSGLFVRISSTYYYEEKDNVYDNLIDAISELINNEVFNKEYLKNTKQ